MLKRNNQDAISADYRKRAELSQGYPILLRNKVEMVTINNAQLFLSACEKGLLEIKKRTFENALIQIHSVHAPIGKDNNLIAFKKQ